MKTETPSDKAKQFLMTDLDQLLVSGCGGLSPVKRVPASAQFGMTKSYGPDGFTVFFTAKDSYVSHDSLGAFKVLPR